MTLHCLVAGTFVISQFYPVSWRHNLSSIHVEIEMSISRDWLVRFSSNLACIILTTIPWRWQKKICQFWWWRHHLVLFWYWNPDTYISRLTCPFSFKFGMYHLDNNTLKVTKTFLSILTMTSSFGPFLVLESGHLYFAIDWFVFLLFWHVIS